MIKRGEIYYADLFGSTGSEQSGIRPILVIQNDTGNKYSPTIIVAAVTTQNKKSIPTHVKLNNTCGLPQRSTVMLEQIRTIDKKRLRDKIGVCDEETMKKIDKALLISFGLIVLED